ncbi:1,4-alpha-glucan branching enzyme [Candidatus Xiphinematobacter sp. Idaho Grape]|uniref:glycoside hydrolase family 57 protein n=1 Tax=Candidatus Xiphinematobacter sp. Idaho Grape TaxID=1704307 RepID=UPI000705DC4C|nr:1,4-alpha-glucan branching protein domain-containing protein [Candidatus Xiphinematobacter sp. Idaho Grape]ALJ56875.1 1,4-alpha-glucan branching enzyme [Candidatus Xiphinematobacter sp. Idaho Grape]
MQNGHLALLLHAHLPFVRHPEHEDFLEEEWLFEAVAETYLPLLKVFLQLAEEEIPFRLTMTLTPTLCAMLRDPLLQSRAVRYLERGITISRKEIERTVGEHQLQELARFYLTRFSEARELYVEKLRCDLIGAFAALERSGHLELITSAATHGFLPLMEDFPGAMRAQIRIGVDYHMECFGRYPTGIWLPECGYVPSVDQFLVENNLRWFVVDAHGVFNAHPHPRFAVFSPYYTPAGPACFARDRESSKQVWSAREGYPGDPAYRDFYRDIGYDLPEEILSDYLPTRTQRRHTGIKYYSITGTSQKKSLYCRSWAMETANAHAQNFMEARVRQMEKLSSFLPVDPIVVSPFDAELFGHWWFEGPEFLNCFLRKSALAQKNYCLSTPTEYLALHATLQVLTPAPSSWGYGGYWQVWLDRSNAWIYPHLHMAARRMIETARRFKQVVSENEDRTLRQMARELLLAQSSDWAFLIKTGTACSYATHRTRDHLLRFTQLYENLREGRHDPEFLQECEHYNNLFPQLNWHYYL